MHADDVRQDWAERSGMYSPEYYAQLGPNNVSEALVSVLTHHVDETAAILEVGCGSGRHLEHLRDNGFKNLTGLDINNESFEVMAEHYPTMAENGTFHTGGAEALVPEFDDGAFDVVYSVETLQHIHPDDEWVFDEFTRITTDLLVTAENEGDGPERGRETTAVSYVDDDFPLYHRNWKQIFSERGFVQLLRHPTSRDTIRAFRAL